MRMKRILLAGLGMMLCFMTGCGENLTPEETGIIRITITPRPVYTTTPVPSAEGDDSVGSNVTMDNEYNKKEEAEMTPTPTPEAAQYDAYGNTLYYDVYGNPYYFDVYGNVIYAQGGYGNSYNAYGGNNYADSYNNYGYDSYSNYGYDSYSYDNYGYDNYGYDNYGYDNYGYNDYSSYNYGY